MRDYTLETLKPTEIESLLSLLRSNLKARIEPSVAKEQGFLTFEYSVQEMEAMMRDMPQPIAKRGTEVAAYALATSKDACREIPLLSPIVDLSDTLVFNNVSVGNQRYYIMGQICVGEELRSQGVFDALYNRHKMLFSSEFDCVLTEISLANLRSQAAHKRVGFETIHHYSDGGVDWAVVAWDWK